MKVNLMSPFLNDDCTINISNKNNNLPDMLHTLILRNEICFLLTLKKRCLLNKNDPETATTNQNCVGFQKFYAEISSRFLFLYALRCAVLCYAVLCCAMLVMYCTVC